MTKVESDGVMVRHGVVTIQSRCFHRLVTALIALFVFAWAAIATAATPPASAAQIGGVADELTAIDRALDMRVDDKERQQLRVRADTARATATAAATDLQGQFDLIEARIAQLGPVIAGTAETPEIVAERANLSRQRSVLDSAIKRARLLAIEGQQLVDEIQQSQAEQFSARISSKVPSPLTPTFWAAVFHAFPRDARRAVGFVTVGVRQIETGLGRGLPWQAALGLIGGYLVLMPGRQAARRLGRRLLIEEAPGQRIRRSANAIWRVAVGTLSPVLAGVLVVQGLRWSGLAPARWADMLDVLVGAAGFAGFAISICGAMLMTGQPSWRIAPIADDAAIRLRPFPPLLGALSFVMLVTQGFVAAIGASDAAQVAITTLLAMLYLMLIGAVLLTVGRLRAERTAAAEAEVETGGDAPAGSAPVRTGLGIVMLVSWIAVAAALLAVVVGYVQFGLLVGQFIVWLVLLGSAVYLLMVAVDDIASTVFTRTSGVGLALAHGFGLRGSTIDQFGVLLSGVLRVLLAIVALGMLVSPFGAGDGVGTIFGRLGLLAQGVQVGGITISPGTILRGIVVLFVGLTLLRTFMGWLERRYLPATDLDGNGRNSISLIARYLGVALAVIWTLASLGIGVERIALLLSALSVGIGFGLQAITQNFVSGLILLAERPIKIGDLIRVGTDEGDVKRISVRSTEIELGDHSTLIVPNSELITKSVLNKTLGSPLGRIQIQFSVPIGTDAPRVRRIVLDAFAAETAVLADPAPNAFVDGIVDGRILFNCMAQVSSPRAAYGARSNVLLALLHDLREAGVEIGTVAQRLELVSPPDALPNHANNRDSGSQ
jgi:small-conductance mechanosensitive channel